MLKPLTLSVSLAIALGASSVVLAEHGKSLPTPQGPIASAQEVWPSAQGVTPSPQGEWCGDVCAPKKHCLSGLLNCCKPRPKCYTYTWVLKKKRCGGGLFGGACGHHNDCGGCGDFACDSCGGGGIWPSSQYPSPQGIAAPQSYAAPQGYSAPQTYSAGQTPSYGAGQASTPSYGAGQTTGAGQGYAPAPMYGGPQTPPAGGMEAPPAPEGDMAPPPPSTPEAPPAPPAPGGGGNNTGGGDNNPSTSLLFLAPSGN
jgi:hypothetical protein